MIYIYIYTYMLLYTYMYGPLVSAPLPPDDKWVLGCWRCRNPGANEGPPRSVNGVERRYIFTFICNMLYIFMYIHSHISPAKDNPLQVVSTTQVFRTALCRVRTSSQFHPVVTYFQHKLDTTWRRCLLVPALCACDSRQGTLALHTYGMRICLRQTHI